MAYTYLTATAKEGTADACTTDAIDTTGATLLVVYQVSKADPLPDISDSKSNSWSYSATQNDSDKGFRHRYAYCVPSSVGSGHTFSVTDTTNTPCLAAIAFSGAAASPYDSVSYADSAGAAVASVQCSALVPSENNCVVVTAGWMQYDNTLAVDAPCTRAAYAVGVVTQSLGIGYDIQTTATSRASTWSKTTGDDHAMAVIQASFKAAAGAAGQFARPTSTVAAGNWDGFISGVDQNDNTNLDNYIDETSYDDADSIRSAPSPSDDTCTIGLSSISNPAAGTVTLRVRARWL